MPYLNLIAPPLKFQSAEFLCYKDFKDRRHLLKNVINGLAVTWYSYNINASLQVIISFSSNPWPDALGTRRRITEGPTLR